MEFQQTLRISKPSWAGGWRAELPVAAFFAVVYALLIAVISPRHEFPINDDWIHAQAVRHLLSTGQLQLPGITALNIVFNIYWGALFAWLAGGLSFTALRFSTLFLSLVGVVGLYALLRQLGAGRWAGVLGATVLLFNPLYVYLSYSFMTDVPFVALMILSLNAYVYGVRHGSDRWLAAGSALAALAFLSRQPGLVLPLAAMVGMWARGRGLRLKSLAATAALPLAVALVYYYWLNFIHGVPWVQTVVKMGGARDFLSQANTISTIGSRALVSLAYLGLWASPFLIGRAISLVGERPWRVDRSLLISAAGVAGFTGLIAFATGQYAVSLPYLINTINWNGLGTLPLLGTKISVFPAWINKLAEWVAIPAGGWLAWLGVQAIWRAWRGKHDTSLVIVLVGAGFATGGYFLLQDFYDRYLLSLVPAAIGLALHRQSLSRLGSLAGWVVCATCAAYSLVGIADYLDWNEARWAAGHELVAEGIPPAAIDGGYEWTGWYEFESAPPPDLVAGEEPPLDFDDHYYLHLSQRIYWLSFSPLENYRVYSSVPYGLYGGRIYVLTQDGEPG